ncbi:hydrolase [Bordetella ansorpii]|uniref:N-acetylmuramoyl-L-alanine amidase n=1 Tax=Bordetella ansorpii TaxID=288768 RepID=A0A157STG2_9BORD|nr:N-acetylmuramoyl-L-alanine amidase [Bordetella ansorpii]SAI73625.1 hydrolase [Bordetella ansorpii]
MAPPRLHPLLSCCPTLLLLAGCATQAPSPPGLDIDTSIQAVSHGSRVRHVVLHYTSTTREHSLQLLSRGGVSSHYLITDDSKPHIYRLVPEDRSAWHAGPSGWYGQPSINATSIGIEIVNAGWTDGPGGRQWQPYAPAQVRSLITLLQDIVKRHGIEPRNVVGHSDVTPQRKVDPGPLFPWRELAQAGIGRWYDDGGKAAHLARLQTQPLPDVLWFQQQLKRLGYDCPQDGRLEQPTRNVLAAFQMHYRPAVHDGTPDTETAAIMLAML